MTDIPETVYAQARNAYHSAFQGDDNAPCTAIYEAIARAILAERERCARVVERGLGQTNTAIARAVRNGDAP